jgi:hypothetical protein
MDQIGGPAAVSWSALNGQKMAMRQPGPPEVSRPGRRPCIMRDTDPESAAADIFL